MLFLIENEQIGQSDIDGSKLNEDLIIVPLPSLIHNHTK